MTRTPRDQQHQHHGQAHHRSRSSRHHSRQQQQHHHHHRRSEYSLRLHPGDDEFSFISPCVKYSLFLFNLVFWIVGGSCVGLGVWSFMEESSQLSMIRVQNVKDIMFNISLALVFLGVIVFSMSFAGCLGALRENLCLLKLYSLMLLILFIGEIVLSTVAFVFPNSLSHYLKDTLAKDPLMKYRDDANLQNLIDVIQRELKCCGISDAGYKDWSQNIYFNCSASNPSPEKCAVPYSCCRNPRNFDVSYCLI
jgi:tetraspanin-33